MKILRIVLIVVVSLTLIGGAGYLYASSGIKSKPGYADITTPSVDSENALVAVNVGPGGVKPLRWFFKQVVENSEHMEQVPERVLIGALQELQGVQIRVYDARDKRHVFDSAIADTVASLKEKNWQTLVTVRDDEEQIVVLQYGDKKQIAGLSIMASTPDKALFLNVIGPFDVERIAAMQ